MDPIKEAFQNVRQDIDFLYSEVNSLKLTLEENNEKMHEILNLVKKINEKTNNSSNFGLIENTALKPKISTNTTYDTTHNPLLKPLKPQNMPFSTGNQGVSTDRQTDKQTDKSKEEIIEKEQNSIENAAEMLDSLDNLKKQIRLKFKRLTNQEFLVFSAMYQLDEEFGYSDYHTLSNKLNLTESSIRDYVGRIIKKGISVEKQKINNKNIRLVISSNLKKIASLPTILQLREL